MQNHQENYYNILNVTHNATKEEITFAYNEYMQALNYCEKNKLHVNNIDQEKITKIKEAFLILTNDEKRKAYDLALTKSEKLNKENNIITQFTKIPQFSPIPKTRFSNKLDLLKILIIGILGAFGFLYVILK